MKILVVQLLRLGDAIQVAPVLEGLRRKHLGATVDVLCFESTRRLQPLMPYVDRWWSLDRDELQAGLGRGEVPLLTSFDVLKRSLDEIRREDYDLVINLTHNAFSGNVVGYLGGRRTLGLAIQPDGRSEFNSPWFEDLNRNADRPGADVHHHVDAFWRACGLDGLDPRFTFARTEDGEAEIAPLALDDRPLVVAQLFTSDARKTWGSARWLRWLEALRETTPDARVVLLAAPAERAAAEAIAVAGGATLAVTSLAGALALLDRARVCVTGDTSVKHLACATPARIVELCLGPADYRRTGVYRTGDFVVSSTIPCAPCAHSGSCTQPRRICAETIDPRALARLTDAVLRGREPAGVLRTERDARGFWTARPTRDVNHPTLEYP